MSSYLSPIASNILSGLPCPTNPETQIVSLLQQEMILSDKQVCACDQHRGKNKSYFEINETASLAVTTLFLLCIGISKSDEDFCSDDDQIDFLWR